MKSSQARRQVVNSKGVIEDEMLVNINIEYKRCNKLKLKIIFRFNTYKLEVNIALNKKWDFVAYLFLITSTLL